MPELPEVETVRRGLQPAMEGAVIRQLVLNRKDLRFPFPAGLADLARGKRITGLSRRAKYLLIHLEGGTVLISHLGMSGSWRVEDDTTTYMPGDFHHERSKLAAHDHVIFHLEGARGERLRAIYNDPRRFGFLLAETEQALAMNPHIASLGVEPTGNTLDGELLAGLLAGKAAPLKAALLDQHLIAGLGNIYVCEALWRAKLSPRRKAGTLVRADGTPTARCHLLADAIRAVIAEAITAGGSSLRDHIQTDGTLGYFQHSFAAYDREGEACRHDGCGGKIRRIVQSGRSTFLCTSCQR